MNPSDTGDYPTNVVRPTVEYRGPDGSAFTLLLLAAVTLCAERGLSSPEAAELARRLERRTAQDGSSTAGDTPSRLPAHAVAAAGALRASRSVFEDTGFPAPLIDHVLAKLEAEQDEGLSERLRRLPDSERLAEARRLMHKDLHKH
jgi:glutamine synthetase